MKIHDFHIGQAFDAYTYLGAHPLEDGTLFRTWAPGAASVSLIGAFSGWEEIPMSQEGQSGIYAGHVPSAGPGMLYKYRIYAQDGSYVDHSDPYAFGMELRPASASVIMPMDEYSFTDKEWMRQRDRRHTRPLNIYEMHFGSWRQNPNSETGWYKYHEIADELIAYVKENGYNYIEFMPLAEHPADISWGYQTTGFFAPTSRYGTPRDLMELVDKCHAAGIGVIMDFVPVHFAVDAYALADFDGTALYEYPSADVSNSEWGSCNFIHSRGEVCSFLQSAANYWLREYHFDGLRMDAVSRLLYWQGDPSRGENGPAIEFIKNMNAGLRRLHPTALLIAEDSTSYPKVTAPVQYGGLGFDYKWDLGWMNDTLDYFRKTPDERIENYHKLTFSMMYYYNELFLLPLSHDEVVHGKATIVQKMYGDYEGKFPQGRAFYVYMMAHPGKKLNFMGNEFAQLREWDETRQQDWPILEYPLHDSFHHFMRQLNILYQNCPPLYEADYDPSGFRWLDCHQEEKCIYVLERLSPEGALEGSSRRIVAAFNFSDKDYLDYMLRLEAPCTLRPLLHSNWQEFGGTLARDDTPLQSAPQGESHALGLPLHAYSGVLYEVVEAAKEK